MAHQCEKRILVYGEFVRCGGDFREHVEDENGRKILYETCTICSDSRVLHPIELLEVPVAPYKTVSQFPSN